MTTSNTELAAQARRWEALLRREAAHHGATDYKHKAADVLSQLADALESKAEPLGYMSAGHVHELQQRRIGYAYIYPEEGTGASVAVYAAPVQPEPLGRERVREIARSLGWEVNDPSCADDADELARAIEAAHGIGDRT